MTSIYNRKIKNKDLDKLTKGDNTLCSIKQVHTELRWLEGNALKCLRVMRVSIMSMFWKWFHVVDAQKLKADFLVQSKPVGL